MSHLGDRRGLYLRRLNVDELGRGHIGFDFFELGRGRRRFVDVFGFVDLGDFHRRDYRLCETARQTGIKCPTNDHMQKNNDKKSEASPAGKH